LIGALRPQALTIFKHKETGFGEASNEVVCEILNDCRSGNVHFRSGLLGSRRYREIELRLRNILSKMERARGSQGFLCDH
jgi:hypothetical protein